MKIEHKACAVHGINLRPDRCNDCQRVRVEPRPLRVEPCDRDRLLISWDPKTGRAHLLSLHGETINRTIRV